MQVHSTLPTDLTIIIPHYNTPSYLEELLRTIPARENIQVIVIDDRSDKEVDAYRTLQKQSNYKHVVFLSNTDGKKGAGTCRNIGLQYAKGKWVLFADADDLFTDGFYNIMEKHFASEYDVVFFAPTSIERDTMSISSRHLHYCNVLKDYLKSPTQKNELAVRYSLTGAVSKMIKLELINRYNVAFDEIQGADDIAFATQIGLRMNCFHVTKETIYCITCSPGSQTMTVTETNYDAALKLFLWKYRFLKENLSKKEFGKLDYLEINKGSKLFDVLKFKLGFRKLRDVIKTLRSNAINILSIKYLNPFFIVKAARYTLREIRHYMRSKKSGLYVR